jgi:hypothetical protein
MSRRRRKHASASARKAAERRGGVERAFSTIDPLTFFTNYGAPIHAIPAITRLAA